MIIFGGDYSLVNRAKRRNLFPATKLGACANCVDMNRELLNVVRGVNSDVRRSRGASNSVAGSVVTSGSVLLRCGLSDQPKATDPMVSHTSPFSFNSTKLILLNEDGSLMWSFSSLPCIGKEALNAWFNNFCGVHWFERQKRKRVQGSISTDTIYVLQ